jgi:peptide/nickel transport system permease protein
MTRYLLRRVLQSVPLLLAVTLMSFVLLKSTPGGPLAIYRERADVSAEDLARLRQQLGLDDPLPVQYLKWLGNLARGDWGTSYVTGEQVVARIGQRLPATLYLMSVAFLLTLLIALPVGVLAAVKQYSILDYLATGVAFIGLSMPVFWFGLLAILLFGVQLGWLPTSGIGTIGLQGFDPLDRLRYLVLPASVLALVFAGGYTRYVRASLLEVIHQDYVRTARSKGLTERAVILGHAFRNALIPVVTLLALDLPDLFTGAVVTETIFAWPGMGRLYLESVARLDYSVLMAILTVSAALVILGSLLADVAYAYLDPRIRYA